MGKKPEPAVRALALPLYYVTFYNMQEADIEVIWLESPPSANIHRVVPKLAIPGLAGYCEH